MQASINTDLYVWVGCSGMQWFYNTYHLQGPQCTGMQWFYNTYCMTPTFKVHSVGQAASVKCKVCSRVKFYCISSVTYGQVVTIPNCVHPFVQQSERSRTVQPLQFQQF